MGAEVEKDAHGYLLTDHSQKTNLDGVYAAGDVCVKDLRQVVTAVSDGAAAATSLEKEVSELHKKLGIPELVTERNTPQPQKAESAAAHEGSGEGFLNDAIRGQLQEIFGKFRQPVVLKAWLNEEPLSGEILGFLRELEGVSDKLTWKKAGNEESAKAASCPP
ncbi:MAG: FAD-dependent oxidoreductase [Blautia marasmi]